MSAIDDVLAVCRSMLGTAESPPGSNDNFIVDWYNANVERIGRGAWCEMSATRAYWLGGAKTLKRGRAYTVWAANDYVDGYAGGTWNWGLGGIQPGDQIYYDWHGAKGSTAYIDHTGIVERVVRPGVVDVFEGNISDRYQRIRRDGAYVVGYGRPDWSRLLVTPGGSPASAIPSLPKPKPRPASTLTVDGKLGPKTIARWQQLMGTPVDGVISAGGSDLVTAVQRRLNAKSMRDSRGRSLVVDGLGISSNVSRRVGPSNTIYALQRYLGTGRDGYLDSPSQAITALQRQLNAGRF